MSNHQQIPSKQTDPSSNHVESPTQGTSNSCQNISIHENESKLPSSLICNNIINGESSNTAASMFSSQRLKGGTGNINIPSPQQRSLHQTTRRSNEISHHNRKLHRHHSRHFSKNNLHRFMPFNRRDDGSSITSNAATLNRQHLNPMVFSLLLCMSLYMVITFASDVAIFYKPSWSTSNKEDLNTVVSFGVDHGREIRFSPISSSSSSASEDIGQQEVAAKSKVSNYDSATTKEITEDTNINAHSKKTVEMNTPALRSNTKHQPVLSNIRRSSSSIHSVPIFYPSKVNMLLDQDESQQEYPNEWDQFTFSLHDLNHFLPFSTISSFNADFNGGTFLGIVIGFTFSIFLIVYGPNVIRKRLLEFQSRRLEAQVHRSR